MSVTILKQSNKQDSKEAQGVESLVDKLGLLEEELLAFEQNPEYKKVKVAAAKAKKELLERLEGTIEPDEGCVIQGDKYSVTIGEKANKRTIFGDAEALKDVLGEESYFKLAGFKLSDLDKYLNPEQLETVVLTEKSGARKLTLEEV